MEAGYMKNNYFYLFPAFSQIDCCGFQVA